jgi:hypothetical protein
MVAEIVACGPDLERHAEAIGRYADAGFDELYVQQVGDVQERFFEVYASEILPRFHGGVAQDGAGRGWVLPTASPDAVKA